MDVNTVSYGALLRRNRAYRRLWLGLVVSQAGDWFRVVALYHLVLELTGASGLALGWLLIAQSLSMFLISPLAGVLADRLNRKTVMIGSDLVRAVLVLGFLFLDSADELWLAYALTAMMMAAGAFFHPALMAVIPNITRRDELVTANALASATWAAMLAIGSGLGGLVTAAMGTSAAFCMDAASYGLSALLIAGVAAPSRPVSQDDSPRRSTRHGWQDFVRGVRYIGGRPILLQLLSVKAWSAGVGGSIVLLATLFAENIYQAGAGGIGLIYMMRGLGAVAGPMLARRVTGERPQAMYRAVGLAFLAYAATTALFAYMPTLYMAAGVLCLAAMAANILWVFSSTLLQLSVPDAYRGRVFAADFAVLTILMAVSTWVAGWALDHIGLHLRTVAAMLGIVLLVPGLIWSLPPSRRLSRALISSTAETDAS